MHYFKFKNFLFTLFFGMLFLQVQAQPGGYYGKKDTVVEQKRNRTKLIITAPQNDYKEIVRLKNGEKHGLQEKYTRQGTLEETSNYKKGKLHGNYVKYFNGNVISEIKYKRGKKHGKFKEYQNHGTIKSEGKYKNDLLTGKKVDYHNNGQISNVQHYRIIKGEEGKKVSVLHGDWDFYYADGHLGRSTEYRNGEKDGLETVYYQNSKQVESSVTYKGGKKHGAYVYYHRNGNIDRSGSFYEAVEIDGETYKNIYQGESKSFYPNGQLKTLQIHDKGKKQGTWEYYTEGGVRTRVVNYKDDLVSGETINWSNEGVKTHEANYKIIEEDGERKSVLNGEELHWHSNGSLASEVNYMDGVEHGTKKFYYASGQLKNLSEMQNGKITGSSESYYEDGSVKTSSNSRIIDGKQQTIGWKLWYEEDGNLKNKEYYNHKGEKILAKTFSGGIPKTYLIDNFLEFHYFPEGKLMSVQLYRNHIHQPVVSYYFFKNENLRRLRLQMPGENKVPEVSFLDNEELLQVITDKEIHELTAKEKEIVNNYVPKDASAWVNSALFSDETKNGKYQLFYSAEKPFLEINFKDDVIDGKYLVLEPTNGDTLVYANFKNGKTNGYFVEKFAGKTTVKEGETYPDGSIKWLDQYQNDGTPITKVAYTENSERHFLEEYHANGQLKALRKELTDEYVEYSPEGHKKYEKKNLEKPGWSVYHRYHPNTNQLERLEFYFEKKKDSIQQSFHKNGQVHFEIQYRNGKKNGYNRQYDEDGNLVRQGQYVDDKREGTWTVFEDGKARKVYYENGDVVVQPSTDPCACADTSLSMSQMRFVPTLETMLKKEDAFNALPGFLKPVDSLNYDSIFVSNFIPGGGRDSGSATLKLLMFKEFSFYLPADEQVKITLNPCRTEGYLSNMHAHTTYSYEDNSQTYVYLDAQRIALELSGGPLQSSSPAEKNFRALFNVLGVNYSVEKNIDIEISNDPDLCISDGNLNDMMVFQIQKIYPVIFQNPIEKVGHHLLNRVKLSKEEQSNFFGILMEEANVQVLYKNGQKLLKLDAETNHILAGGKYVAGKIDFNCKKASEGIYEIENEGQKLQFSTKELENQLSEKGFSRISFDYDETNKVLSLYFFAQ